MTEPRRHLGVGAAASVFVQGGPLVAAGVLSIVLARTIGPSGNGRFSLLVTLTGMTAMVASLGLTAGITYEVSRRRWSIAQAARMSFLVALVLGAAGFLGGLGVFELLRGSVFHEIRTHLAALALASLPAVLAYQFADAIMLARERYERYAALEFSHALTMLVVGAGLAIPFGLLGAVIGLLAAGVVGAVVGQLLLRKEVAAETPGVGGADSLPRALRFGIQSWLGNLLQQVNYRFDIIILGGFASAGAVGVYSVALTLTAIVWVLPQAIQTVLFPRAAGLEEAASIGEITAEESDLAVTKAIRHGVLLALPATLVIVVLLLVGVPLLYGSAFAETTYLGFVLLPGVVLLGLGKIIASAIAGRGYPRYTMYASFISTPMTLALYFGLIPPFHAWGAAIASSASYGLTTLLMLAYFRRLTRIGVREAFIPLREDVADYIDLIRLARARR